MKPIAHTNSASNSGTPSANSASAPSRIGPPLGWGKNLKSNAGVTGATPSKAAKLWKRASDQAAAGAAEADSPPPQPTAIPRSTVMPSGAAVTPQPVQAVSPA